MDSKLTRWCNGLIEAGWLVAVIVTPLFFNVHSDRVFEPDKLTLLRSIALVMGAAWIVKAVDERFWTDWRQLRWREEDSLWRRPFVPFLFLLVLVYLLSNLFSVTPSVSWAGSYQRLQGTYTTLSYIVIFLVTISTMRTQDQMRRLGTAVILTSIPVSFYGLLQHFSLDPLPWAGSVTERIAGHMGNPIFIAAYLIMAVPLTLGRIIASFSSILNDEELATADVIRSSIYIFTLAIQLIAIYWSGSRGPWLGLAAGLFAFILIVLVALRNSASDRRRFQTREAGKGLLFVLVTGLLSFLLFFFVLRALTAGGQLAALAGPMSSFVAFVAAAGAVILGIFILVALQRGWRWLWFSWITLSVLLAGWLLLFNIPPAEESPLRETALVGNVVETLDAWRELPRVGRLGTMLAAEGGTGRVRVLIWQGVLELVVPHEPLRFPDGNTDRFNLIRPLLGYGPESMYVAYNRYYPPELAQLEARNASPDRSHNETFDALVITGLAGFLVWQALYFSIFYYGFKWLGVLRSRRDRNLLLGLWIGVGVLVALLFAFWRGTEYIGVALPFGSIAGLILYLIYYALFAEPPEGEARPFAADRLLVIALLTAVVAHFVEIHFGIAIAATRTHFFLFIAGIYFMISSRDTETDPVPAAVRRNRRRTAASSARNANLWGTILLNLLMIALMIGIMGYTYTTFSQPPDFQLESTADLTAGMIFQQSFFVNPQRNFADSPFLFLMVMLTWVLGVMVAVSEMAKDNVLRIDTGDGKLPDNRRFGAAGLLVAYGVLSVGFRLLAPAQNPGATYLLGNTLTWVWGGISLWAGVRLFLARAKGDRFFAGSVAMAGFVFSLPVFISSGVSFGLLLLASNGLVLYLLWFSGWQRSLLPVGVLAFLSLSIGLLYALFQAGQLRFALLYRFLVPQPETVEALQDFLISEASVAANFLTYFYLFVFLLMLLVAFVLAQNKQPATRRTGSQAAYGVLLALILVVPMLIFTTNIRVIQADIIYKRGKFYDNEATRTQNPDMWENAIALYKNALDRAPREDFYYLFLGRAYLELAELMTDPREQQELLMEAENQLKRAQEINPLNTDHTANLARLSTRWAEEGEDGPDPTRLEDALRYYQDAISLSPQNAVIRNEYARITYVLGDDCDQAITIYEESALKDPFYSETRFSMADTMVACATEAAAEQQETYYRLAISAIEEGLELERSNARAWLRAGQIYHQLQEYEAALNAYSQISVHDPEGRILPSWNVFYLKSRVYNDIGEYPSAISELQAAISAAPADVVGQLQLFLNEVQNNASGGSSAPAEPAGTAVLELGERPLAAVLPEQRNAYYSAYPEIVIDLQKSYQAVMITEKGELRFQLLTAEAPITVNNFVFLATQGFYDGTTFHRVIPDFMAQGGDPTGSGTGYPGYFFEDEMNSNRTFDRPGLLGMANTGQPASNGSQFFITFAPVPELNGRHTIFGELVAGDEVLAALTPRDPEANPELSGDRIERIEIIEVTP